MKPQLLARLGEMQTWRRDLHRRPELAFREERTSRYVEEKLRSFGVEVHRGLAKTGLVGVIRASEADDRAIWLGNGPAEQGKVLHSPHYDFNDEVLSVGASYWAELVERALPKRG